MLQTPLAGDSKKMRYTRYKSNMVTKNIERHSDFDLAMNITRRCNRDCGFCYLENKNGELPYEKVIDILNLTNAGILTLTGGEPLIRADIFDIIQTARNLGYDVNLLSNGDLLTTDVAKQLKKFDVAVYVSYNGDPKVLDNIRAAVREGLNITTQTILTKETLENKVDKFLSDLSILNKNLFLYPTSLGDSNLKVICAEEWYGMLDTLMEKSKNCPQKIYFEPAFAEKNTPNIEQLICPSGKNIFVDTDGKSYPCCLSVNSFPGCDGIKPVKVSPQNCKSCGGGCPVYNKEYGHDPRCDSDYVPICPLYVSDKLGAEIIMPNALGHNKNVV